MTATIKTIHPGWLGDGCVCDEESLDDKQLDRKCFIDADSSPMLATPTTPVKLAPALDPATIPRLRTSMSSHDRLIADDSFLPDAPTRSIELDRTTESAAAARTEASPVAAPSHGRSLVDLPGEVQERIIDMLMGEMRSTASWARESPRPLRNWSSTMRHPRSRTISDLALVCPLWRLLVQERIYRHIKLEGTIQSIHTCWLWFINNRRLGSYVRHVDFWVPIWERKGGPRAAWTSGSAATLDVANQLQGHLYIRNPFQSLEPVSEAYRSSSQKSTLDEIFDTVFNLFPSACVLTIEGGQCKRPPMIEQFRGEVKTGEAEASEWPQRLAQLPAVHTLVLRGAWNVIRSEAHFCAIRDALPGLREWHCSYTKPKAKAYRSMHRMIVHVPHTLTHLNLSLDGFYSQAGHMAPHKAHDLLRYSHLCDTLGALLPQLEVATLSGRFCAALMDAAAASAQAGIDASNRRARLRTLDISVKNCCRPPDEWSDGAGIHNWGFICAFEQLIAAAARALSYLPALNNLRIRYVDLDAENPLLHPYFHLRGYECSGLWTHDILRDLARARPAVAFADLSDSLDLPARSGAGFPSPTRRPKSIRTAMYAAFIEANIA